MYHVYVFAMSNNHTYFSMNKFSKDYARYLATLELFSVFMYQF